MVGSDLGMSDGIMKPATMAGWGGLNPMGDLWEAVENRVSGLSQLRVRRVLGRWRLWYFGFTKQETASCDPGTPALAAARWPEGLETTQCDGQGQVTDRTAMAVLLRGVTGCARGASS